MTTGAHWSFVALSPFKRFTIEVRRAFFLHSSSQRTYRGQRHAEGRIIALVGDKNSGCWGARAFVLRESTSTARAKKRSTCCRAQTGAARKLASAPCAQRRSPRRFNHRDEAEHSCCLRAVVRARCVQSASTVAPGAVTTRPTRPCPPALGQRSAPYISQ